MQNNPVQKPAYDFEFVVDMEKDGKKESRLVSLMSSRLCKYSLCKHNLFFSFFFFQIDSSSFCIIMVNFYS